MPGSSMPASKSFSKMSDAKPKETQFTQNNYFNETVIQPKSPET